MTVFQSRVESGGSDRRGTYVANWHTVLAGFFLILLALPGCRASISPTVARVPPASATAIAPGLPAFDLPPPRPSARAVLPRSVVLTKGPTLGNVADTLTEMLNKAGYADRGFYSTPDGFAIATQMERINPDGTPFSGPDRWRVAPTGLLSIDNGFSLVNLLNALVHADPGHYRVFVFLVTDVPVTGSPSGMPESEANALAGNGAASLPSEFRAITFGDGYNVTALVYEFDRASLGAAPNLSIPSALSGEDHLRGAGLLP